MSVEKLLKEFGIDDLAASITDENFEPTKNAIIENVKKKLFESEEFFTSLPEDKLPREVLNKKFNEGVAKVYGVAKKTIDSNFRLTAEDKAQFSEEDLKDIQKYTAKAAAIYKEKTNSTSADISKLQDENLHLKQELESRQTEIKSISEKFESDLKEKLTAKETETLAMIEASALQANVPVGIGLIWDKVFNGLKNKYAVIVENGVSSLRKKDNNSFKVEKADKSGYMELKDAIVDELKGLGAWVDKAQNSQTNQPIKVEVTPNGYKGILNDTIQKKIESEKDFYK